MPYLLLALAIAAEIAATVSLKLSNGFSRLVPSIVMVAGYAVSFVTLAKVLKMCLPIGGVVLIEVGAAR